MNKHPQTTRPCPHCKKPAIRKLLDAGPYPGSVFEIKCSDENCEGEFGWYTEKHRTDFSTGSHESAEELIWEGVTQRWNEECRRVIDEEQ